MSRSAIRALILAAALAAAAFLNLWLQGRGPAALNAPGYALVADLDTWRATPREREVVAAFDLHLGADWTQVPLHLGEWAGQDVPQDNLEVYLLLQPEQYLFRQYRRADGSLLWLSLLGGREARSFHPPQICYLADGWRTEMQSERIALDRGELWAMHLLAQKGEVWHSVLYFYLWPSRERAPGGGTVLFKVTAPLPSGSREAAEEALATQKAFLRAFFRAGR